MADPQIADSSIGGAFGHKASCRGQCPSVQNNRTIGRILAYTVPACLKGKRQGSLPGTETTTVKLPFSALQLTAITWDSVRVILPCLRSHTAWSTTRCFGRRLVLVATARLPVLKMMTQAQHRTTSSKVFSSRRGVLALPHLRSRKQHVQRAPLRSSSRRSSRRRNPARSSTRSSWSGRRRTPRTEQGALCDPVAPIRGLWPWLFPES